MAGTSTVVLSREAGHGIEKGWICGGRLLPDLLDGADHDRSENNVLLVPGGDVHGPLDSESVLEWVTTSAAQSDYVLSVCNGAFILAKAGLLDDLQATTFYGMLDDLEESYPKVQVVRDQRYTDNGKVLTSAGLSAGIDASIYLVSKLKDEEAARSLALHLEYGWDPDSGYVRGELADRHLPDVELDLPEGTKIETLSSLGDSDAWVLRLGATTDLAADELLGIFETSMKEFSHWQQVDSDGTADKAQARWSISTERDGLWSASAIVSPAETDIGYLVTVRLERRTES